MKNTKAVLGATVVLVVSSAIICGCSSPKIPITMKVAGEVKLAGVSKIALIDFNTLPDDPFTGKVAADSETCALVQRAVASAFYKTPVYQVANLSSEQAIAAVQSAQPSHRFDAIVYGRLWWQLTPETTGEYPKKYTLESWENVSYKQKTMLKEVDAIAKVVTQKKDVIRMLKYRTRSAALMLSLAFYRVDGNGGISKIVEVYQVSENGFTLMNGEIKVDSADVGIKTDSAVARLQKKGEEKTTTAYEDMFQAEDSLMGSLADAGLNAVGQAAGGSLGGMMGGFGNLGRSVGGSAAEAVKDLKAETPVAQKSKVDANGKIILSQETIAMPSELQAKLILAAKMSGEIAAKVAPSEVTFKSNWVDKKILWVFDKRFDARLTNLLENRAWDATRQYVAFMIRKRVGEELSKKFESISEIEPTYPVAKSTKSFNENETDDMMEYFAKQRVHIYLYALGIAQEASGDTYAALDAYMDAFNVHPMADTALGISRCTMAIGQAKRLNETKKEKSKATGKTKLD